MDELIASLACAKQLCKRELQQKVPKARTDTYSRVMPNLLLIRIQEVSDTCGRKELGHHVLSNTSGY